MNLLNKRFGARFSVFGILLASSLLIIFLLLLRFDVAISQGAFDSVVDFDKNGNGTIQDSEFFAAVDQWIAGQVSDSLFFQVVDAWIEGDSTPNGNQPPPPPPNSGDKCPKSTRLVTLQNGIPFVNPFQMPEGFVTGLDIAFSSDVYLPQGTNLTLNITSDRAGLSPTEVFVGPPFTQASITQLGQLQVLGIGTVRDGANVPRNHEWARFTPFFSGGETFGNFSLDASFKAPGCPEVKMGGSVRVSNPAASALNLVKTMVTGNEPISIHHQVRIRSRSNSSIYRGISITRAIFRRF